MPGVVLTAVTYSSTRAVYARSVSRFGSHVGGGVCDGAQNAPVVMKARILARSRSSSIVPAERPRKVSRFESRGTGTPLGTAVDGDTICQRTDTAMLHTIQARAFSVLLAALGVPACGSQSPSVPTPPSVQTMDTMSGPPIAAHSNTCWDFNNAKAGPVSADVTPRTIHLTVTAGKCSAPGQTLAEKDGEVVNAAAPAGWNHVTLSNPSDSEVPYTLRITYWR